MARTDATRGVWKAPAGLEAGIVGVSDLTVPTDDDLSGLLNPHGVNVLRTFPAAGMVVWGARTLKGDDTAELGVQVRTRAQAHRLHRELAVPRDPVRRLRAQRPGPVGSTAARGRHVHARACSAREPSNRARSGPRADSFFVVCDETVNPQSEIDLGRVNVVVGFAPLKPAEFVIITITQISKLEA